LRDHHDWRRSPHCTIDAMQHARYEREVASCCLWAIALIWMLIPFQALAAGTCKGLTVAVDTGHSASSPGAISARGKTEYLFNDRFTRELREESRDWPGLKIVLIPTPSDKRHGLLARSAAATDIGADVFVSIHHDSVNKKYKKIWEHEGHNQLYADNFSGYSVFVSRQGRQFARSLTLAKLLGERLRAAGREPTLHHAENLPNENRELLDKQLGVYEAPFVVLTSNKLPAILFEVGIIVNRDEELKLEDRVYRATMQKALLGALDAFCSTRSRDARSEP
jgi:N-acetylmuramoyl-L-alanine amidase